MMVWIEWENENVSPEEQERLNTLFQEALNAGLEVEGITEPVEISVTVMAADEVRKINQEFREIDRTTDVLSFPMLEYGEESISETIEHAEKNPDSGCVILGDIVLNYEQALVQAEEYGHSKERELTFLLVHSLLHLLGYDHMEEEEEAVMREHQRRIMAHLQEKTEYEVQRKL